MGGLSVIAPPAGDSASPAHRRARRVFLVSNYMIIGAASGCGFLTLSLRLVPSVNGFLLILLHALTVAAAVAGCAVIAATDPPRGRVYTAQMAGTVVVSILQGATAVLAFSRTDEFLFDGLRSYVREEDGAVILRMVGGLGVAIFCLEWVALALAFVLRYHAYVDRECGGNPLRRSAKVGGEDGAGIRYHAYVDRESAPRSAATHCAAAPRSAVRTVPATGRGPSRCDPPKDMLRF